jgi:hypothetical protein
MIWRPKKMEDFLIWNLRCYEYRVKNMKNLIKTLDKILVEKDESIWQEWERM